MKQRRLYENAFLIAPKSQWGSFYAYRKEYPDADFSLHTQEDVESLFSYHHEDDAVIHLLKKGKSYEEALDILGAISFLHHDSYPDQKLMELVALRDELLQEGLLYKEEYPERSFLNHTVVYHGYPNPLRTRRILDMLPGNIMNACTHDFEEPRQTRLAYHQFNGIYEELHYVYNRIAKLLDDGVSIDDIYLYGADETYAYLLPRMNKAYGFAIETPFSRSLDCTEAGIAFLKAFQENDLPEALESIASIQDEANLSLIQEKAKAFYIPSFSKEKQIALYQDVFRTNQAQKKPLKNVVRLLKEPFAPENSHIFYVDFSLGKAPSRHADEDYLSDAQKKLLYRMTSKEEGQEEKENLQAFLSSGHIAALCFHQIDLSGEKLLSPLAEEGLDPHDPSSKIELDPNNDLPYEYSKDFLELELAHLLDLRFDYRQEDSRIGEFQSLGIGKKAKWKSYDSQYKPFIPLEKNASIRLSYSRTDQYYKCPFSYYLENILGLQEEDSFFAARRGSICHKVMEWRNQDDFEFATSFEKALTEEQEANGPFSYRELILLSHARLALLEAVNLLEEQEKKMVNLKMENEYRFPAIHIAPNTILKGTIDKLILTGPSQEYLTLVDYKTGSVSFKPEKLPYGLGMQLPTYAYAVKEDPKYKDKDILGLFIHPIGLKTLSYDTKKGKIGWKEYLSDSFAMRGAYTEDSLAMETLLGQEGSSFLSGKKQPRYSEEILQGWIETVKGKYLEADSKIRAGEFPIHPLKAGFNDDGCQFCSYRDICYLRESMHHEVSFGEEEEED